MRKSPIRHKVKKHIRKKRVLIRSYLRGSGQRRSILIRKVLSNPKSEFKSLEELNFVKRLDEAEELITKTKFKKFSTKEEFDKLYESSTFRKIMRILSNTGPKSSFDLGEKYFEKFRELEIKLLKKILKEDKICLYRGGNLQIVSGIVGKSNFEYGRNVLPFSLDESVAINFAGYKGQVTKVCVPLEYVDRFISPSDVEYQVNLKPFPKKYIQKIYKKQY